MNPIGLVVTALALLVTGLIIAYKNSETFRGILDTVFGVVKKVVDFLRPIGALAFDGLKLAFGAIKTVLSGYAKIVMGVFDAFKAVYNFLKPITSKAFDGIKAAFNVIKKPVDLLITALRKAKELFEWFTSLGGKNTPTVAIGPTTPGTGLPPGFKVPRMAAGGIVRSPTLALIGEAGPEAVVPLSGRNAGMGMTINVQAGLVANPDQIGQQIIEAIQRAQRRSGPVFAPA
jgi:hypothetical protein